MRRTTLVLTAVLALALLTSATTSAAVNTKKLRKGVTVDGILAHERAFQQIANQNGGIRAANTPGYDASVEYVSKRLRRAGYRVTLDPFDFPLYEQNAPTVFEQISPTAEAYVEDTDFITANFSGSGSVEKPVVPADNTVIPPPGGPGTSVSGCDPADFPASTSGNVSLIQRGTCPFTQKIRNADEAGAAAVIIFNDGFRRPYGSVADRSAAVRRHPGDHDQLRHRRGAVQRRERRRSDREDRDGHHHHAGYRVQRDRRLEEGRR